MPIHDWTRVDAGLFHHFYQDWSIEIARTLNAGRLPTGYYALVEQRLKGPEPDVIAVETGRKGSHPPDGATAVLNPPRTHIIERVETDAAVYARRANRITIRHQLGDVVAVIEIVAPGNKDSRNSLRSFLEKAVAFLRAGVNLLIVDLFPPTARDPHGIHKAIADEFHEKAFDLPHGKPLTLVSYDASDPLMAYIEPVAVGDPLPDMALFLAADHHVAVPLEATYAATWAVCPEPIREMLR